MASSRGPGGRPHGPEVELTDPEGHLMNPLLDALGAETITVTLAAGQAPVTAQPFAFYAATRRVV